MKSIVVALLIVIMTSHVLADSRMYKCEIITPDAETVWLMTSENHVFLVSWRCEGGTKVGKWVVSVQGENRKVVAEEKANIIDPKNLLRLDWYLDVPPETDPGQYTVIVMSWGQDSMALLNNKVQIMRKIDRRGSQGKGFSPPPPEELIQQTIHEKMEDRKQRLKQIKMREFYRQSRLNLKVMNDPMSDEKIAAIEEHKPFVLTGMMKDWRCMTRWQFEELERENRISEGIDVQVPNLSRVKFSKWNRYRKRYIPENVEQNEYLEMKDFFEYYPAFLDDIQPADHILGTRNFLSAVDDDIYAGTRFELCPARSGIEWKVNSFNSSQLFLQVVGERRFGLFPKESFFVPGYHHNDYRSQRKVSTPFSYWAYTLPALTASGRPHFDVVLKPGEILYVPSGYWVSSLCLEDSVGTVMDVCHKYNIRECMDELRDQSDSASHNHYGTIFVQLREKLGQELGVLTDDDFDIVSPYVDENLTIPKLREKDLLQVSEYLKNASQKESISYEEVFGDIFQPRPLRDVDDGVNARERATQKDEL